MKCNISYKNVEFDYSRYFDDVKIRCPFCQFKSKRTKTFRSLKELTFHLANQHSKEGDYYPFDMEQIQSLIRMIGLAKEWRIL